jgi:hypothetical protein
MKLKLVELDHLVVFLEPKYVLIEGEIEVSDAEGHKLLGLYPGKLEKLEEKKVAAPKAKVLAEVVKDEPKL